jgi:hypothetical protein
MLVPLVFAATLVAAESRCNTIVSTQLQDQVRGFDSHPPADADLATRMSALQDIIDQANQEQDILAHVCPAADFTPLLAELLDLQAWTYVQQADAIHREFAANCPGSSDAVSAGFLAAAWSRAERATPGTATPSPLTSKVVAMIQKRAAPMKLDLPAAAGATDYWVKTVQDQGRAAAAACPTPQA